ncbi:MAG: COG4280 domain-containing protein [Dehalococcoidia bacterium]
MRELLLVVGVFFASLVEMVEALTIVLAVGITRGWRAALLGLVAALVALIVAVAALGPSLVTYVPLGALQVVIGVLLLIFGLQWLRKAVLRASGRKALHDEEQIFSREVAELREEPQPTAAFDWTGFTVSFKGVFLEGLEVAFIVLTFGTNEGRFDLSIVGAAAALVLVSGAGLIVHRPLSRVPENAIKFAVGLLLTTFGTFWGGEGIGINWAMGDLMLPVLLLLYAATAALLVRAMRPQAARAGVTGRAGGI